MDEQVKTNNKKDQQSLESMQKDKPLLEIKNLSLGFHTEDDGFLLAIRNLSFSVARGETLAIVGESGCGKSVTAHAITGLVPSPPAEITNGEILFEGSNLLAYKNEQMRQVRGRDISMIFQEPMTSLNPAFRIGQQIADVVRYNEKVSRKIAWSRAIDLINKVKIPDAKQRVKDYPHQLSGGMRQRVMIAMALASPKPKLMIADEPTTALDVTVQAQILSLLSDLKDSFAMSLLLITHDMGVVAQTADRVIIMYAGRKVEEAGVEELFAKPKHPYTIGLLNSLPAKSLLSGVARIPSIPGSVPSLKHIGDGCPFVNRCDRVLPICSEEFPKQQDFSNLHTVMCHANNV